MAKINGENIKVGDELYDLVKGYGIVASVEFNNIAVVFNNGVRLNYADGGFIAGVRRLYWHDPVIADPPKDYTKWQTLSESIKPLIEFICQY